MDPVIPEHHAHVYRKYALGSTILCGWASNELQQAQRAHQTLLWHGIPSLNIELHNLRKHTTWYGILLRY